MIRTYYILQDKNGGWYTDSKAKAHLLFKSETAADFYLRNKIESDNYEWEVRSVVVIDD